ncbi:MAG: Yip1 family protein [Caldimonas sp.]
MSLIERVQSILLRPKQTWPVIAAESTDVATIYSRYVVILAAIPAICGFIGWTLVGAGAFGVNVRLPIGTALIQMIVGYLLSLGVVYVLALIVNALAPTFAGTKDMVSALKVVAYGSTAGFIGGVFSLLPSLSLLGLIASIYSIYLIYTGLPVLMRCPPEKAGAYTAVVIVCGILAMIVIGAVSSLFVNRGPMGFGATTVGAPALPGAAGGGDVQIKAPDGTTVTINPSAMADMAKRMEEAGKRMESAQKSGDTTAAGKAMGEILGAATGGGNVAPIAAADLKAMLPESIGDMKRTSIEAQGGEAMGIAGSGAKAAYAAGERRVELSITDTGGLAGLATMAGMANMTMDKETDGKVEKVYKDGARTVHEEYRKDGSHGEMAVILANGVVVAAEGSRVDIATLKNMVKSIDLAKLEATKRVAKR